MGSRGSSGSAKIPNSGTRNAKVTASSVAKLTTEELEKRMKWAEYSRNEMQKIVDGNKEALRTKGANEDGIKAEIAEDSKYIADKNKNIKLYEAEVAKRISSTERDLKLVTAQYNKVAKALNHTNSKTARDEFDKLSKQKKSLSDTLTKLKKMQKPKKNNSGNPLF